MLTDAQIKRAKPAEKDYRLTDGGGLHLFITRAGGKLWRFRYEISGREKLLSLGQYPAVSLLEARRKRDEAKDTLRAGRDPSVAKKLLTLAGAKSSAETFQSIAEEWHDLNKSQWVARHAEDVIGSLRTDIFPTLGSLAPRDITPADVLTVLRPIEQRGAKDTARRIRQRMSAVFVYAIATGRGRDDPAATVKGAMAPMKKGRQPAVTSLQGVRDILRNVELKEAHPVTKLAHRLLALTAVRPGTLIMTPWSEFDELDDADPIWQIPAARMKLKAQYKDDEERDHLVPLSKQAMAVIAEIRQISGRGPIVFPNTRHSHRPMSENAIGYLLNRSGYHHRHVPHGWRAAFSSIMNEAHPSDSAVIDLMLAHVPKDKVEGAYNRALHLKRRKELAQAWADLLLEDAVPLAEIMRGPRR